MLHERDGIVRVPGPPRRLLRSVVIAVALALAAAGGGALWLWSGSSDEAPPEQAAAKPDPMERAVAQALQQASATPPPAAQQPAAPEPQPEAPMDSSDKNAGIAAFPPPGTKPIKAGIIVPDGYQLPPGYVRHVQTTDDGEELPPILMFHPDFQPRDASGQPVPVPPDRVVPPELAPPGMPIQLLTPPPPPAPK